MAKLESQVKALNHDLDRERTTHESVRQQLEEDVARQTQRAETAADTLKSVEKQLEAATAAGQERYGILHIVSITYYCATCTVLSTANIFCRQPVLHALH